MIVSNELNNFIVKFISNETHKNEILNAISKNSKQHYIDISLQTGFLTFLPDSKLSCANSDTFFTSKYRQTITIGRFIRALNTSLTDVDIEKITHDFKAYQISKIDNTNSMFQIIKGDDIIKWYNEENYAPGSGTLNKSCMRYEKCKDYFTVYTKNPDVFMLAYIKNGKLHGRALVWKNVLLPDNTTITYMERIYSINNADESLFKLYAIKNSWWFKVQQSYTSHDITNGITNKAVNLRINLPNDINWNTVQMPYMDSFQYMNDAECNVIHVGETVYVLPDYQKFANSIEKYSWGEELIDKVLTVRETGSSSSIGIYIRPNYKSNQTNAAIYHGCYIPVTYLKTTKFKNGTKVKFKNVSQFLSDNEFKVISSYFNNDDKEFYYYIGGIFPVKESELISANSYTHRFYITNFSDIKKIKTLTSQHG